MADKTVKDTSRWVYETLDSLKSTFDAPRLDPIYPVLCDIQKPSITEPISGQSKGGFAHLLVPESAPLEDKTPVNLLREAVKQLKSIHKVLFEKGFVEESDIYLKHANQIEQAIEDSKIVNNQRTS